MDITYSLKGSQASFRRECGHTDDKQYSSVHGCYVVNSCIQINIYKCVF